MPKKIRILHLIKSLGRGGAEKLIPETALVHHQEKFEFYCLYFYHQKKNIVEELIAAGIKVHLIPSGNLGLFFQVKKVREFVKQNDIDIIHAHLPWAGILSRLVGNKLEIPIVYTEHNTWDRYNSISYWGNRMTFKKQDVAIAVSNEVALSMQLNSMLDPYRRGGRMKVKVIQNGVNTEVFRRIGEQSGGNGEIWNEEMGNRETVNGIIGGMEIENEDGKINDFSNGVAINGHQSLIPNPQIIVSNNKSPFSPNLKEQYTIPQNAKVIGIVAVFRDQKRLWIWIDLALKILQKCPETHFLLVGDGEWRKKLEDQIEGSGKSRYFHLVGVQKNVIPYLSIMDLYLSTSAFEGLPIAMLEAMSCKVPVVATRAGGIGEVVQHGIQGYLSEIDDFHELVDYAVKILGDSDLQEKMAKAARLRVKEQFSMNKMVQELEEVYEMVLKKNMN